MLLSYNNLHCNLQWPLALPCNQSIAKQPSNLPETSQNTNGRTDINRTKIKNKYSRENLKKHEIYIDYFSITIDMAALAGI